MLKFYLYDDPVITMGDWLAKYGNEWNAYLDKDLYEGFKRHPLRTDKPEEANIFIIGIPMWKSFTLEKEQYLNNVKTAILKVVNNKFFKRNNGKDHLILADHWMLSGWADCFFNKEFKKFYQDNLEFVTSTRYEVWGISKWHKPSLYVCSKIPSLFYNQDWEVTRYSITVPYRAYINHIITPNYDEWIKRKNLIFYYTENKNYWNNSTEIRMTPVKQLSELSDCSAGYRLPHDQWKNEFINSKFALVVRGDTPGSHSFVNGISVGCIPVIISDLFEYGATPFKDIIELNTYSIIIQENEYLKNPSILYDTLKNLKEDEIRTKLNNLIEVQKIMLTNHPESKVCSLILDSFIKINR